ncbi:MAG: RDD family protein [Longicatena sp.]
MKNKKQAPVNKGMKEQYFLAKGYRELTKQDTGKRVLSFLLDLIVMLAPIMIWDIIMLAVLGNMVSISGIVFVNIVIGILLVGTILCLNVYIYKQTGGQSIGMRVFGFKVVKSNGKPADSKLLATRELLGFDIPFIVLMLFLNIFGVALYWLLNGLVVLVDKKHRSMIDFILKTSVIALEEGIFPEPQSDEEKPPVKVEKVAPVLAKSSMDLHIHSNFSVNGKYNIEEIFQIAKKKGLRTISITDLDCAKSNGIAARMSELYKVKYVPGIEINCNLHGRRVRVLGYFIEYNNELYAQIENDGLVNEKKASIERVQKFEEIIGQKIDINCLLSNNRFQKIPGELIARHVLTRPEFKDCSLLQPYLYGNKKEDASRALSKDFFAYGKPCYVQVKYPLIEDIIDVITLTGGISVIAHPGKLLSQDRVLLEEVLNKGIQGIEVFHPMHTKREMANLLKLAKERKLFITCGSGFYFEDHKIEIGTTTCPKEAETLVERLINAKI